MGRCRPLTERLCITDRDRALRFVNHLEARGGNGVATRNARLAALHTFARFLAAERPETLAMLQAVLGISFKRGPRGAAGEHRPHSAWRAKGLSAVRVGPVLPSVDTWTLSSHPALANCGAGTALDAVIDAAGGSAGRGLDDELHNQLTAP